MHGINHVFDDVLDLGITRVDYPLIGSFEYGITYLKSISYCHGDIVLLDK